MNINLANIDFVPGQGGGGGSAVIEGLTITSNGTYTARVGVDGYSPIEVNVPGFTEKEATEGIQVVSLNNSASFVKTYAFYNVPLLQTVNLPNCYMVSDNAFTSCSKLTTVNLPMCSKIGNAAFRLCYSLSEVNLPMCITINNNAFASCTSLSEINLPECLSISQNAFTQCSSLSEVNLPMIRSIQVTAFNNCRSLNSLTLCTDVYWTIPYNSRVWANTPIMSGKGSIYVRSDTYSQWITKNGWSSLSNTFVSMEVSGPILSYSNGMLSGTTKALGSDFISYLGVTKEDITEVSLPECKYFVSDNALGYTAVSNVYLPKCLDIESNTFYSCSMLSMISLPMCSHIGNFGFAGCESLTLVNLPVCSRIDTGAFLSCYQLSQVNLPLCEYIGNSTFGICYQRSQMNLPMCSYIGDNAFSAINSFSLTLGYNGIVKTGVNTFSGIENLKIYVPSSLVDAYKSAENWSVYSSQIFPIE